MFVAESDARFRPRQRLEAYGRKLMRTEPFLADQKPCIAKPFLKRFPEVCHFREWLSDLLCTFAALTCTALSTALRSGIVLQDWKKLRHPGIAAIARRTE